MTRNILNSHRSIILLNGTPPHKNLITSINTTVLIIAADGAASKAYRIGLAPTYVVGDGDSYTAPAPDNLSQSPARRIIIADQDTTDFEKCIAFAQQENLLPALVLGISGGEIDHVLGNMHTLLKYARPGQNSMIPDPAHSPFTPQSTLYFLDTYLKPGTDTIGVKLGIPIAEQKAMLHVRPKSTISIVSFGQACISTRGLKWELNNFLLSPQGMWSLRNETLDNCIECDIQSGRVLIIIDIDL